MEVVEMPHDRLLGRMVIATGITSILMGDYRFFLVIPSLYIGHYLNWKVCSTNSGTMPVFSKRKRIIDITLKSKGHHLGTKDTKLKFLADVIDTQVFSVWSLGDIFKVGSAIAAVAYVYNLVTAMF